MFQNLKKNTNCMLINVNLHKHQFDSFTEIIKIKNSLFNVIKNKLSKQKKSNFTLNEELKNYTTSFQNINHINNY